MTLSECSNMDWALEEILFQEAENHVHVGRHQTELPKKEDYIEALHQLLEHHVSSDEDNANQTAMPLLPPSCSLSFQHLTSSIEEEALPNEEPIPVLSPPEGYRDDGLSDHENEHEPEAKGIGSMTVPTTCPGDKQGFFHRHLRLPGQQDSGPEATFPYHYQDEARCLLLPPQARCITDLQNRENLIKISGDAEEDDGSTLPLTLKHQQISHPFSSSSNTSASKAENVDAHHVAKSSPILSSLLAAEPTLKQKHATFPASVEHDSGIESIDSLSPKDLDSTPICSPMGHTNESSSSSSSILTSLLSTPSKETTKFSPTMLSTLLTCSTKAERPVNELANINVVSLDPFGRTLVNQGTAQEVKIQTAMDVTIHTGDHELSLAEFLDGCAKVVNGDMTSEVVRSSLEDITTEAIDITDRKQKTPTFPQVPSVKHDDFEFICQSSEKVVPEWDTDLNLRLKQLDSVLANAAKTANSSKSANLTTSEDSNQAGTKRYSCPQCPGTFNSCAARSSHRRKVHERFYMCHECDMAFGSSQKLERHMKTHSGIKEFRCETCGKEFMIERNLILHYKLHLGQKDFKCSVCHRTYFTKSGLQAHLRQLHAPPSSKDQSSGFSCKDCHVKCLTRYELMMHRKLVHAGVMYGERCSQCSKSFKTLTELKRHTISDHSNRAFPCPQCPHKSKTKDKLDRHMLSHSVTRESFQCLHCQKKFVFKNSLKKHLEKKRCEALKLPQNPLPPS